MKVTVIGSHLCPDTLYALNRLSEVKAEIEFKNPGGGPFRSPAGFLLFFKPP